jgi:hypothetical protein
VHILFVDESGTPPKSPKPDQKYFVMAGLIIPEEVWHDIHAKFEGMKRTFKIYGEIKWRYFAPGNTDEKNPMREMSQALRDMIRARIYQIITRHKSVKCIGCVTSISAAFQYPGIQSADDLYHLTYKAISERFQYYLQDLSKTVGRKESGIVICDPRLACKDDLLRTHHNKMLAGQRQRATARYLNLIETLFFVPSDLSMGIQLADMVAGAIWLKYARDNDKWYQWVEPAIRKGPAGQVEGFGIVKLPKKNWS